MPGRLAGPASVRWGIGAQVAFAWLLTLPAAAAFGAVAAWMAATGPVGTIIVALVLVGVAGGVYAASRRRPVTADNVNDVKSKTYPRGRRRSTWRPERRHHMTINWGALRVVAAVSLVIGVLVVVLVSLALVGLSAREPEPASEPADEALVIARTGAACHPPRAR